MNTSASKIHFLAKWAGIGILLTTLYLLAYTYLIDKRPFVEWTMVNVSGKELQADAHLLKMPDGKIILIDIGDPEGVLVPYLKKQKITDIDLVLISHMHRDHYLGLLNVMTAGVRIKEIRLNLPSKKMCDLEIPWGCDWGQIQEVLAAINKKRIPVFAEKAGDIYYDRDGTKLEVLYAFDETSTPVTGIDVNDMSVVLRLSQGGTRALFTGDLNSKIGSYLAEKHCTELKSQILKVPHHGTESLPPNSFFDCVGARIALVSSPQALWVSERSHRTFSYFDKKVPTYISGIHGQVKVLLRGGSYKIKTAR